MAQELERRGVALVGWLIGIAAALRLLPLARLHPIVWDEIEFFRATDFVARGLVPYRDFWEHHTPLQWFVFAPVAALVKSPGVGAILAMRWAQLPLWIVTFVLLWKWMRGEGLSALGTALAVLFAVCSTQFMLAAIEYRVDALGCALFVTGLFLLQRGHGAWAGAALCLAGFANVRLGPILVLTILLSRLRWRAIAGAAAALAACLTYFLLTHSAAVAWRNVWTENYIADRIQTGPPQPMFRRYAAIFGVLTQGFDAAAVDVGSIVIVVAGGIGAIYVLATRWRTRDSLFVIALLQVANLAFIAKMKFIYHYHFLIVTLLALPFVAYVVERLLARGYRRVIAAIVMIAVAVSAFASVFRGKEDGLAYQDMFMREADRLIPPHGRVFGGVGYAIRHEPAYRYWFLPNMVQVLEGRGIFQRYDIAADPPEAVILDIPTRLWFTSRPAQAEFVRRHYLPSWPELWLPGMSAPLTRERPSAQWIVPADGTYIVRSPLPLRLTIDGVAQPPSYTLMLRKRQRLEAAADVMEPIAVFIVPAGGPPLFRRPPAGITLDANAPPRTHVPRLW
jgi:hypothetical protein